MTPIRYEPTYVRELARALRPALGAERLFAVLIAYLDDSKEEGACYTMAGYVATAAQWDAFEGEWRQALAAEDVDCFHMKSFAHFKPPFTKDEWPETRRATFLAKLIDIINRHTLFGASCTLRRRTTRRKSRRSCVKRRVTNSLSVTPCACGRASTR
jgi:hypothetical protein